MTHPNEAIYKLNHERPHTHKVTATIEITLPADSDLHAEHVIGRRLEGQGYTLQSVIGEKI
jgi:hypothetical protein